MRCGQLHKVIKTVLKLGWQSFFCMGAGVTLFLNNGCYLESPEKRYSSVRLIFFDVGQGDAFALQAESGSYWLFDAGPPQTNWDSLISLLGPGQCEALFLSHADRDHIGGAGQILSKLQPKQLFLPGLGLFSQKSEGRNLLRLAKDLCISVDTLRLGARLQLEAGLRLRVLWPPPDTAIEGNNASLVMKLDLGNYGVLLTGDIETPAELMLLKLNSEAGISVREEFGPDSPLKSNLLKVAHHGSRSSTLPAFLKAVSPQSAVISTDGQQYGHPHAEALTTLSRLIPENQIYRTDQNGSLILEQKAENQWIVHEMKH